ncbi:MAG: type I-C CRISPR-associated protein Cas8c/Csd1 [Thermomicrobiales bacterium]|nr:type I-C CRISPR-associated protein Cas8c/Csd1 [Thermomicrobiales bacterium]
MLLQRLVEYAERELELPPAGYQVQPIRYLIDLDGEGGAIGPVIDTADPANKATKFGVRRLAPHVKRANGIKPKLLTDTGVYVFGLARPDDRPERVAQQHEQFVELVRDCAERTGEPAVAAELAFLESFDPERFALPDDFDPAATVAFRVDGVFPFDLPTVHAYWARLRGGDEEAVADDDGEALPCVICGNDRPALSRHPLKIKGIPGGQMSGTDLISANSAVFESFGLANSLIAPTCARCAETYGNALNALLANPETRLILGNSIFIFWTAEQQTFSIARLLSTDDPAEVKELLAAPLSGAAGAARLDASAFYALGLGASGSRVVVRSWLDSTVGAAKQRLIHYFALQQMVERDGQPGPPLPLGRLARATVRDPKKDAPAPEVTDALLALALAGSPLPLGVLAQATRRCRANQGVGRAQAALIKMALCSEMDAEDGRIAAMSELDERSDDVAYRCGRLLAVLDAVQRRSLGTPNATLIDKYYGSASSAPAAVFGTLLAGAQHHMAKLRKDERSRGAYVALDRRLQDVMEGIDLFPRTLTLPEQGMFALGYYHQRADDRRQAQERRDSADSRPNDGGEDGDA